MLLEPLAELRYIPTQIHIKIFFILKDIFLLDIGYSNFFKSMHFIPKYRNESTEDSSPEIQKTNLHFFCFQKPIGRTKEHLFFWRMSNVITRDIGRSLTLLSCPYNRPSSCVSIIFCLTKQRKYLIKTTGWLLGVL